MIYIQKGTAPLHFLQYCNDPNATFDDMDRVAKEELRTALLKEQGEICAYCMKRIKNNNSTKIEHYVPRNSENQLDYKNLLAVCNGNEGSPYHLQTCDTKKGNKLLYANPQNESQMETIGYKRDGSIYSIDAQIDNDLNGVLNLNCEQGYLKRNRKAAYDMLIMCLQRLDNKESAERVLRSLEVQYKTAGQKKEYVGILLYFVAKYLQQYKKKV